VKTKIVTSFISLVLFVVMVEAFTRIFYTPQKVTFNRIAEFDTDRMFRLKKNYRGTFAKKELVTNSFGYRDAEIPVQKGPRTYRILMIGDSVFFGHGVEAEYIVNWNSHQKMTFHNKF